MSDLKRFFLRRLACLPFCVAILGCEPSVPPSVPTGPPTTIALRVGFYVPVLGTWLVDGFSDSLREELAKYDVAVAQARASAETTAVVTLGDWSDHLGTGRSIGVVLIHEGGVTPAGRVWTPDLSDTTLSVAAEQVAVVIVRLLRGPPSVPDEPSAVGPD